MWRFNPFNWTTSHTWVHKRGIEYDEWPITPKCIKSWSSQARDQQNAIVEFCFADFPPSICTKPQQTGRGSIMEPVENQPCKSLRLCLIIRIWAKSGGIWNRIPLIRLIPHIWLAGLETYRFLCKSNGIHLFVFFF